LGTESNAPTSGLSEELYRPLGIGYDGYGEFLRQYAFPSVSSERNPDLGISLTGLQEAGSLTTAAQRLRRPPRCLIQGITSPRNGTSLRQFLETFGVAKPIIHAIDIADVAGVLATMNMSLPDVLFSVADAASLPSFVTGSVQILVQDHLLNCTPHGNHEAIIREAARVLDKRGFLILNFSVDPRHADQTICGREEFEGIFGRPISDHAYCLRDLTCNGDEQKKYKSLLMGRTLVLDDVGRMIVITPPHGNFEFYFPKTLLEERLARHGLQFEFISSESGVDSNGIRCLRYRTIVRHRE
jgi:hypothetical protein